MNQENRQDEESAVNAIHAELASDALELFRERSVRVLLRCIEDLLLDLGTTALRADAADNGLADTLHDQALGEQETIRVLLQVLRRGSDLLFDKRLVVVVEALVRNEISRVNHNAVGRHSAARLEEHDVADDQLAPNVHGFGDSALAAHNGDVLLFNGFL